MEPCRTLLRTVRVSVYWWAPRLGEWGVGARWPRGETPGYLILDCGRLAVVLEL